MTILPNTNDPNRPTHIPCPSPSDLEADLKDRKTSLNPTLHLRRLVLHPNAEDDHPKSAPKRNSLSTVGG